MLSKLLKPASKENRRKLSIDGSSLDDDVSNLNHQEFSSPRTPSQPRLQRARNLRWHLMEIDKFDGKLLWSEPVHNGMPQHELSSPRLSEAVPTHNAENEQVRISNGILTDLPGPKNSSEVVVKSFNTSPLVQEQQVADDCDDGDRSSSGYSAGSSSGSLTKSADTVRSAGEEQSLSSSFTNMTRRKVSTTKKMRQKGNESTTMSTLPPLQEIVEATRPGSPLPVPSPARDYKEDSIMPMVPYLPDVTRGISRTIMTIQKCNPSGPLRVRNKRDHPLPLSSQRTFASPSRSDVERPVSQGRKSVAGKSGSDSFQVQKKDVSSIESSSRSPLPCQQRGRPLCQNVRGARCIPEPATPDELHTAHPLPLPWSTHAVPVSPRSNTSSAERSEDSCKVDSPLVLPGWSHSPSEVDSIPRGGRWIKGTLLGSGSFGKVYRGHHSETGDMCAIKEVEIVMDDPRSKECANQLAQEIALLSTLRHPNILHYKGSQMVDGNLYIYLELVSGGSIYRLLQEFNSFSEPVIRRYARQILLGLEFLHARNTVHRDIKCANILVDQDGRVKLADFGMAKLIGNDTSPLSFKGSPHWMAPEVILQNNTGHEFAVDIWSLGCTIIEMATGKPPWHQYEGYAAMFKVMNSYEVPIPESLSPIGKNFLSLCLQRDPAKRPSATALLDHPFVQIDTATNYPSQVVNDTLYQGMMKRCAPRDCNWPSSRSSEVTKRDLPHYYANGYRPTHLPHHGYMSSSRSAIQLSEYSKPRPSRDSRRFGGFTDTEDYASWHQSPIESACGGVLYRDLCGIQEIQALENQMSSLNTNAVRLHSPTN
ncbi:hypothetical protein KP509_25G056900 [Ceratopteris richardii]|uniref:mitogen-activated protein kinase kinase kinase n=1 Tax=Ceratopteris richardii TaxID=49495 RepID=A0A8T2RQN1_CERRI|nr:hypothetical protein KP509_25G056900 [Ceratopteris richardii]KAH7298734.1 hypothetical protein KP509_25G056900 [Ceratopteris richardii]